MIQTNYEIHDERHKIIDTVCTACGGAGESLPTHCPGYRFDYERDEEISQGNLDYISGMWVGDAIQG